MSPTSAQTKLFSGVKTTFYNFGLTFGGVLRKPATKQNQQNNASLTLHFCVFFLVVVHIVSTANRSNVSRLSTSLPKQNKRNTVPISPRLVNL